MACSKIESCTRTRRRSLPKMRVRRDRDLGDNVTQSVENAPATRRAEFSVRQINGPRERRNSKKHAHFWVRGQVPKRWTAVERNDTTLGLQGSTTWQPDIYSSDGSGDVHSQDPRLRRAGWGIACLKQDAELKEACHGSVPGRQTVPLTVACGTGGKHQHCRGLRGQAGQSEAWNQWHLVATVFRCVRKQARTHSSGHTCMEELPHSEGAGHRLRHVLRHARQHVRRRDGGQGGHQSGCPPKPGQRSPSDRRCGLAGQTACC